MTRIVRTEGCEHARKALGHDEDAALLVEIERQGSLSAAGAAIGIGQPSASQHLRLLEAAAGQRLVERCLLRLGRSVLAGRA